MRVAYGWQGGDSPNGRRSKVGKREVGRKSCWLLVERSQGERDDWNVLPAALLEELEELGATWQGTEEVSLHCWSACQNKRREKCKRKCLCGRKLEERARTTGAKWRDWLRVPIPPGGTFADVVRLFDSIARTGGVSWQVQRFGIGVESWQAMGSGTPEQGKMAGKRVASEKRQVEQQVERSLDLPSLERLLFGSKWIVGPAGKGMVKNPNHPDVDSVPTAQYPGDSVPGNWGNEGEFSVSDWFYLLGKNPRIEQTWKAMTLLPSDGTTDLYSAALERAVNWVRKILSDSPTPMSFRVDAAKAMADKRRNKEQGQREKILAILLDYAGKNPSVVRMSTLLWAKRQVDTNKDQLALLLLQQEGEKVRSHKPTVSDGGRTEFEAGIANRRPEERQRWHDKTAL